MNGMTRENLFKRIQRLAFAKTETELFLDTHPDCRRALDYYHEIVDELLALRVEYANRFGAICAEDSVGERWSWVDNPWPWHLDTPENERQGK